MRPYQPSREDLTLASVLYALSDPIRPELVKHMQEHGATRCGAFGVPLAKSTLSHHFRVLREAGVTNTQWEGTQSFVALRHDDLDARFPGLLDAVLRSTDVPQASPL